MTKTSAVTQHEFAWRKLASAVPTRALLVWAALAILYAVLLRNVARFAYNAWLSAIFSGELDYGEGIVWQQARLIPSSRMYGDLQQEPFLAFNYPPLYHVVVNTISSAGMPWLMAARTVSILSLCAIAAMAGLFVMESSRRPEDRARPWADPARHAAVIAALASGLLIFSLDPLRFWARTARVDMLAYALEMTGMYLVLRGLNRRGQLHTAGCFFIAALFTKQTVLMGAVAAFAVALYYDRRRALRAAFTALALGVAAFAALSFATHGGFARHIISYNVNRFSMSDALHKTLRIGGENIAPAFGLIAIVTLIGLMVRRLAPGTRSVSIGGHIIAIYSVLAAVGVIALGQSGGTSNYLIPMLCGIAMLIGLTVGESARRFSDSHGYATVFVVLTAMLIAQTLAERRVGEQVLIDPGLRRQSAELVAMIRAADKPVFSEDMVLLGQAGKDIAWEPSMISELSAMGVFDEQKIITLINARAFAFAVENDTQNIALINERYSPAVRQALETAYPVTRLLAGKRVLLPRDQ